MSQNNNSQEIEQKLTWQTLETYANNDSTIGLMLCEFIDNSINSFEDPEFRSRIDRGDSLDIVIDYYDDPDKKQYVVLDNANGIRDLNHAMSLYKDAQLKSRDGKCNFGVGMKHAIFWLGANGIIYTKEIGQDEKCGKFVRRQGDDVVLNIIDSSNKNLIKNNSGTLIHIFDVHKNNNKHLSENKVEKLQTFLGYRYFHYLNCSMNFRMNITICWWKGDKLINKCLVKPFSYIHSPDQLFKLERLKKNYDERIEYQNSKRYLIDEHPKLSIYFEKLFENTNIIVDDAFEMTLNDGETITIPIKVAVLDKPDKNRCGISIIHSNRYIMHPATNDNERKIINNYNWADDRFIDGHYKWLIAELDIAKIPHNETCKHVFLDDNKAKIKFMHNSNLFNEEDFNEGLKNFVKSLDPFLSELAKFNNSSREPLKLNEIVKKSKIENTLPCLIDEVDNNEAFLLPKTLEKLSFNVNKKKIRITFDESLENLYDLVDEDENFFHYKFNMSNHPIFSSNEPNTLRINIVLLITILDIWRKEGKSENVRGVINHVLKIIEESNK